MDNDGNGNDNNDNVNGTNVGELMANRSDDQNSIPNPTTQDVTVLIPAMALTNTVVTIAPLSLDQIDMLLSM